MGMSRSAPFTGTATSVKVLVMIPRRFRAAAWWPGQPALPYHSAKRKGCAAHKSSAARNTRKEVVEGCRTSSSGIRFVLEAARGDGHGGGLSCGPGHGDLTDR